MYQKPIYFHITIIFILLFLNNYNAGIYTTRTSTETRELNGVCIEMNIKQTTRYKCNITKSLQKKKQIIREK